MTVLTNQIIVLDKKNCYGCKQFKGVWNVIL